IYTTINATSAVRPLRLHDSLPILVRSEKVVAPVVYHRTREQHGTDGARIPAVEGADEGVEQFHRLLSVVQAVAEQVAERLGADEDRKSTRLNSSHVKISYAVFCLK